jgi:vacuolar-type H+-ATPase subunit E/Vma4
VTVPSVPAGAAEPDVLAPVREALLALARREAERVLAAADADAAAILAQSDGEAEQIRSAARAEATADAATRLAIEESRINRESRAVELRARRAAYDVLVRRAREAMRGLSDEPGLREKLEGLARAELGATATVVPSPDGGVVAEAGRRRISYPLTALAEIAVGELLALREGT